jgi:hypothetical protein
VSEKSIGAGYRRRVRRLALVLLLVVAGCGASHGPEDVLREWSAAVNDADYERAASLFAEGAEVVQGPRVRVFDTSEEARRWNASLPCRARIVRAREDGDTVDATFLLRDRADVPCDAPGAVARVVARVEDGKIVLWHQVDSATAEPEPVT